MHPSIIIIIWNIILQFTYSSWQWKNGLGYAYTSQRPTVSESVVILSETNVLGL